MTECNEQSWLFQELGSRKVEAHFEGGYLSSDGGGLILREFEHHHGLLWDLAGCFVDYRDPLYTEIVLDFDATDDPLDAEDPPVRFAVGAGVRPMARAAYAARLATWEAWEAV
jgi:hypothetical protein